MNCLELDAVLHAYVDEELAVDQTAAAAAHAATCARCADLVGRARALRGLLRRQPRDVAPPELRAQVVAAMRRETRRGGVRRAAARGVVPVLAAVLALLVALSLRPPDHPTPLVAALVDTHIMYAQLERPAEIASANRTEVGRWFAERADMRVTVPDFSGSGIHLLGGRLANADERRAAHLLYEKGRMLLSVFMLSRPPESWRPGGTRVSYGGHQYWREEHKGYRAVMWTDGQAVFGLVSALDDDALLECAARLRLERAEATRL